MRISLDQLPEKYRAQAARKLADEDARAKRPAAPRTDAQERAADEKRTISRERSAELSSAKSEADPFLGATKTEIAFYRKYLSELKFSDVYETVRLRIAPGTFYTPDFVFADDAGEIFAVEVKGSYRLGSASRAYTAFMAARDKFPWIRFQWWEQAKGGEFRRKH